MVEIRIPEISKAVHYIFMTSQRSKILGMEFLPKTPSTETPGFLKFENGENMKHPSDHPPNWVARLESKCVNL